VRVGLEGAAGLSAATAFVVRGLSGADRHIVNGFGTAAWFGILGAIVAAAAWALWTGRRWGRGIAVFTQLLILPVTWYVGVGSHRWFYGVPIAAVALAALVLLFSPATLRWLSYSDPSDGADISGPASADSSDPDTR
jgi:peptidoglycan/LPS O-acetylase OafA/YrhL